MTLTDPDETVDPDEALLQRWLDGTLDPDDAQTFEARLETEPALRDSLEE